MASFGKVNDRRKNPGKVTSGAITCDAHGKQMPLGKVSMSKKKGKRGY